MAKKKEKSVHEIAADLLEIRESKNNLTRIEKELSTSLKSHPDFREQDIFHLVPSVSLKVVDREKALAWTQANCPHLVSVDSSNVKKFIQTNMLAIPEGFESVLTDSLRVKGEE